MDSQCLRTPQDVWMPLFYGPSKKNTLVWHKKNPDKDYENPIEIRQGARNVSKERSNSNYGRTQVSISNSYECYLLSYWKVLGIVIVKIF